jgi:5-methylcytosine-specific restriction protein A
MASEHTRKSWAGQASRHERGYGRAWEKARAIALARDKHMCQPCKAANRYTLASQVDHITPKAEGGTDDLDNLQSICTPCHDRKTQAEAARAQGRTIKVNLTFDADGQPIW